VPGLGERELRWKQLLLRFQDFEVRRKPGAVPDLREADRLLICSDLQRPLPLRLDELCSIDERPRHLAERVCRRGLVGHACLLPASLSRFVVPLDSAAAEYRTQDTRADAPCFALRVEQVAEFWADETEEPCQG